MPAAGFMNIGGRHERDGAEMEGCFFWLGAQLATAGRSRNWIVCHGRLTPFGKIDKVWN